MALLFDTKREQIKFLQNILDKVQKTANFLEKIAFLQENAKNSPFLQKHPEYLSIASSLKEEKAYFFWVVLILEQFFLLEEAFWDHPTYFKVLQQTEHFYRELGGVLGYHVTVLTLLQSKSFSRFEKAKLYPPPYFDLREKTALVEEAIEKGLLSLPFLAEIYPLGGAADRLHLIDEKTKKELPAAKLPFLGKTLLEHLLLDVQAKESLYFSRFGKRIEIPIVIMTSEEKGNHGHVVKVLEDNNWFGKDKSSFFFIKQPSVPTLDENGNWCKKSKNELLTKPSGHGALWKLMQDQGAFDFLFSKKKTKALIRQINNPIAGVDFGLLAFLGYGFLKNSHFGFASCPKQEKTQEGLDLLVERKNAKFYEYFLTNVEYCDFQKFQNLQENSFLANTNLLFADLKALQKAVRKNPFPGLLVNFKEGNTLEGQKKLGRLETTMQNIADEMVERSLLQRVPPQVDKTYVTYNHRNKTISTTKKVYKEEETLETPEKCDYDFYLNHLELLDICKVDVPSKVTLSEYLQKGPPFLFVYHPTLGPIYSQIAQKIQKGKLAKGSELNLQIKELLLQNFSLRGSLCIFAENIMGHKEGSQLIYSTRLGKCILEDVTIQNQGLQFSDQSFWKRDFYRKESLIIELKGKSQFIAKGVTFTGNHHFVVEEGMRCEVINNNGKLETICQKF